MRSMGNRCARRRAGVRLQAPARAAYGLPDPLAGLANRRCNLKTISFFAVLLVFCVIARARTPAVPFASHEPVTLQSTLQQVANGERNPEYLIALIEGAGPVYFLPAIVVAGPWIAHGRAQRMHPRRGMNRLASGEVLEFVGSLPGGDRNFPGRPC